MSLLVDWRGVEPPIVLLTSAEREVCEKLPGWRRREWARGRVTAKATLALQGIAQATASVLPGPDGAPFATVDGRPLPVRLSLSHSGDLLACAAVRGRTAIGVDIERIDEANSEIMERIIGPDDRPGNLSPTQILSCKEAALKATGRASVSLRAYSIVGRMVGLSGRTPDLSFWQVQTGGYVVTTVTTRSAPCWRRIDAWEAMRLLKA